jgi:hypothetical protein
VSFTHCCRTAPIAKSDAFTARLIGAPGTGCTNIVAFARARFDSQKEFSVCSDHSMSALVFFAPFSRSLSEWLECFRGPRYETSVEVNHHLRNFLAFAGFEAFTIASTRSASGFLPSVFTVYPKNVISLTPNTHFAELITTPYLFNRSNSIRRCS